MKTRYSLLCELNIRHEYYDDGILKGMRIVPDQRTQAFMWNAGLLFNQTDQGFAILHSSTFDEEYIQELIEFFPAYRLEFHLTLTNDHFVNFTDMPLDQLVVFRFDNKRYEAEDNSYRLIPLLEGQLFQVSETALIYLYLDQFLVGGTLQAAKYDIVFKARKTQWNYYLMNIKSAVVDDLVISDEIGKSLLGPTETVLSNGLKAHKYSSGEDLIPMRERSAQTFSIKKRSNASIGDEANESEVVLENLPSASAKQLDIIRNDSGVPTACSSMYIYL